MSVLKIDDVFLGGSRYEGNTNKYKFSWETFILRLKLNLTIEILLVKMYLYFPLQKATCLKRNK